MRALTQPYVLVLAVVTSHALAQPVLLDPVSLPKFVTPLFIPPEMPPSTKAQVCPVDSVCPSTKYNIAVRQFKQQLLPAGYPATTVWGYGRAEDKLNLDANGVQQPGSQSSFSSPSFTIENIAGVPTSVRWINELVSIDASSGRPFAADDPRRTYLSSLVPVDPTSHWANPSKSICAVSGLPGTDCKPDANLLPFELDANLKPYATPYMGPVPMVVHVHGADDNSQSDGYPEAWWLPDAFTPDGKKLNQAGFAVKGKQYDQYLRANTYPGSAAYLYENTQPATTLWYHDHSLGITHNNVYAGQSGFWLIRGAYTNPTTRATVAGEFAPGALPGNKTVLGRPTNANLSYGTVMGCDPNENATCRAAVREIPLALQDKTFNDDGSLYYAKSRAGFDAVAPNVSIPYAPSSDVAPVLNPEYFGDTILVNGTTWPTLDVAPAAYRFRILAGGDARTFNLSLWTIPAALIAKYGTSSAVPNSAIMASAALGGGSELPIWQIGAEQGYLPKLIKTRSGHRSFVTPGNGGDPVEVTCVKQRFNLKGVQTVAPTYPEDPQCQRALLLAPAERADVLVKFSGLAAGTVVRLINTGPDLPFGGFPLASADIANPETTGRIMQFVVRAAGRIDGDVDPLQVKPPAEATLVPPAGTPVRKLALVENDSSRICVMVDLNGTVTSVAFTSAPGVMANCDRDAPGSVPFGPAMTMLGTLDGTNTPVMQEWADPISQVMKLGQIEEWELYNFTQDAHPMHIHGTRFRVVDRQSLALDTANPLVAAQPAAPVIGTVRKAEPNEAGYKDVVVSNPREVTRLLARWERAGVYTWHCHIVEHEDNEMMLPMCVRPEGDTSTGGLCVNPNTPDGIAGASPLVPVASGL